MGRRLGSHEGYLVVERGRLLPFGYEPYIPKAKSLRAAYARIEIPGGKDPGEDRVFEDRADVDRHLFSVLSGWARSGLDSTEPKELRTSTKLIERCQLLPGLSEEQRKELRTLSRRWMEHSRSPNCLTLPCWSAIT